MHDRCIGPGRSSLDRCRCIFCRCRCNYIDSECAGYFEYDGRLSRPMAMAITRGMQMQIVFWQNMVTQQEWRETMQHDRTTQQGTLNVTILGTYIL